MNLLYKATYKLLFAIHKMMLFRSKPLLKHLVYSTTKNQKSLLALRSFSN